jgi:hypothetical protein
MTETIGSAASVPDPLPSVSALLKLGHLKRNLSMAVGMARTVRPKP